MVFLVPLATSNFTIFGFERSFTSDLFEVVKVAIERALVLIALGAWAWDVLRRGGRIRHTPVNWLILAFIVWVAVTTVVSIHWPTALLGRPRRYEGLLSYLTYAVIYFLVLQFADDSSRLRRLAQSLFWASVAVAGFGLLQFLGVQFAGWVPTGFEANRAFSTYGNPDFLGGFLIFSVTVAMGLALLEQRLVWRLVYWVGFGLNGVVLIASFTRGAWIGGFVSLVVLIIAAWRQRAVLRRVDWIPGGASLAVGIAIILRSLSSSSEVLNFGKRIASIFQFSGGSGYSRTEIWRAALAAIKDRPFLGSGPDTFRLVFSKYKSVEYVRAKGGTSSADNAHEYLLHLAVGTGIPGALIFCGIFVWAGVRSFGTVFKRSGEPARILLAAFWAAAVGYLVHLLFGISLPDTTFLLWIALAIVLVPTARLVEVKALRWGTWVAALVLVLAAAGVASQGVFVAADNAYWRAQTASSMPDRVSAAHRAVTLNPLNPEYRLGVGLVYLNQMRAYLKAGNEAQQNGEDTSSYEKGVMASFAEAESSMKEAIKFIPGEYDNYVALASLYNLGAAVMNRKDLYQSAIETAQQGLEVMPLGTEARLQLAKAFASTDRTSEATETLEYCVELDPTDGKAALALADLYSGQGRVADALAVLKAVDAALPGQTGIAEAIAKLEAGSTSAP
jgi:O-antigen ligase